MGMGLDGIGRRRKGPYSCLTPTVQQAAGGLEAILDEGSWVVVDGFCGVD